VIVIDASLVLRANLGEEDATEAFAALDYLNGEKGYVPGNFQTEVVHGLLKAERRGRISATDVAAILSDVLSLRVEVALPDSQIVAVTAREHKLSAYDGAYLALATKMALPLATLDERLRKAARAEKVLWSPRKR
jgi:predicted nucleic acid-binding protein